MNPELESQGIGSLPQQAEQKLPRIPSGEVYDATVDAVGQIAPEAANQYRGAMRAAMSDVEIPPKVADILIAMFEYLIEHKDQYEQIVSTLVENGIVPPSMLPDHFDETYIGTRLAALHELKKDTAERAAPMEGMPMAHGGLANVTEYLQSQGRGGDTMLAHINPEEAALLKAFGGSGAINPNTGLPEFLNLGQELKNLGSSISNALAKVDDGLHKVVASPIGKLVATIGLTMIGVPPWLASAGLTAYSGGNIKDVLISGAMGYLGSGGDIMGVSPLNEISKFMPGAAGSLLNSGLASGTLGMGAGLLQGQSLGEALKSGAMAGAQSAALQGLGRANPTNAEPKSLQTFESLSPNSYLLSGNQAPQFMQGEQVPGPVSAVGGIPPAGQLGPLGVGKDPSLTPARAVELQQQFGLHPVTAEQYGAPGASARVSGISPTPLQLAETGGTSWSDSPQALARNGAAPTAQAPTPGSISSVGGQSILTGTTLSTSPVGQGTVSGTGLTAPASSSMVNRALDFANSPSFDNFGKIFSDPNATTMIGKYGPGAAAVLGATALAGGFKSKPAEKNPAFNPQYTGMDYMRDNPQLFGGSLRAGQYLNNQQTVVPTNMMYGIPAPQVNAPVMPRYGGYKTGGNVDFPRKTGQVDGPGTETSDSIPAMLSDGEFVFTAKAVRNAGGGSRRKGAAKMYKLMKSLENGPLGG